MGTGAKPNRMLVAGVPELVCITLRLTFCQGEKLSSLVDGRRKERDVHGLS